jgi:hypothetical protein
MRAEACTWRLISFTEDDSSSVADATDCLLGVVLVGGIHFYGESAVAAYPLAADKARAVSVISGPKSETVCADR